MCAFQVHETFLEVSLGVAIPASVPRSYMRDEGRPLGAGLQEQASNHLKLRW